MGRSREDKQLSLHPLLEPSRTREMHMIFYAKILEFLSWMCPKGKRLFQNRENSHKQLLFRLSALGCLNIRRPSIWRATPLVAGRPETQNSTMTLSSRILSQSNPKSWEMRQKRNINLLGSILRTGGRRHRHWDSHLQFWVLRRTYSKNRCYMS